VFVLMGEETYMYPFEGSVGMALRVHICHGRARVQERIFAQAYSRALWGPSGDRPASADVGAIGEKLLRGRELS